MRKIPLLGAKTCLGGLAYDGTLLTQSPIARDYTSQTLHHPSAEATHLQRLHLCRDQAYTFTDITPPLYRGYTSTENTGITHQQKLGLYHYRNYTTPLQRLHLYRDYTSTDITQRLYIDYATLPQRLHNTSTDLTTPLYRD